MRLLWVLKGRKALSYAYFLQEYANVEVDIVDMRGKSQSKKVMGNVPAGEHREDLDVTWLPNGMYICRFKLGDKVLNRRFVVAK